MPQVDWPKLKAYLQNAVSCSETDDLIEKAVSEALSSSSEDVLIVLNKALEVSSNVFTTQRVALTASLIASSKDRSSVLALMKAISASKGNDDFLYAQLLVALGLLAKRNYLAKAQISVILFQLECTDSPFILISAAKIIGKLEPVDEPGELRQVLTELGQSSDMSVQAEVFQQEALLTLTDALSKETIVELKSALEEAYRGFKKAEASEENRDDATVFSLLLDLMLTFLNTDRVNCDEFRERITSKNERLCNFISTPYRQSLRSDLEQLLMLRVLHISNSFRKIVESIATSNEWTNFDEALVDLVSVCALFRAREEAESFKLDKSFEKIIPNVVLPKIGPVLSKAISRTRFSKVIENYTNSNGNDSISQGLRFLHTYATQNEYSDVLNSDSESPALVLLKEEIERSGRDSNFFIANLSEALSEGKIEKWAERFQYISSPLSIDHPELFGNNPQIDEAVRGILKEIRERLGDYPEHKWLRLIGICEAIVQSVHQIRDDIPPYCLSDNPPKGKKGGKGQNANEHDLQEDLYQRLFLKFGSCVDYEPTRIAGGRSDLCLAFSECEIPIEVKAEYRNIQRDHIRGNYLAQTDLYAAMRDRASFLMILDLRASNSGVEKKQISGGKETTRKNRQSPLYSPYTLKESLYIDGLPSDPQIENAQKKAVIVVLVPGNRPKPSWGTRYSQRPAK